MEEYQALQAIANYPDGEAKTAARSEYFKIGSLLGNEIRMSTPERVSRALPKILRDFYSLGGEKK